MSTYFKRFKVSIALCLLLASCTALSHLKKKRSISADKVKETCNEPTEYYPISPATYGVYTAVMRFKGNCLGFDDLLVSIWYGEDSEFNETVAKLMILLYINSQNANNEAQLARVFLKKDAFSDNKPGDEVYMLFYELVPHHNE